MLHHFTCFSLAEISENQQVDQTYHEFLLSEDVYQSELTAEELYESYIYKDVVSFPSGRTDSEVIRIYELLQTDYADVTVSVGHSVSQTLGGQEELFEQTLSAYMLYNNYSVETPYYIFDSQLLTKLPKVRDLIDKNQTLPDDSGALIDVFTDFDAPIIFSVGKNSSGLSFHMHRHSYNELFYGEKLWFVYNPGKIPPIGFNPWNLQLHWIDNVYHYLEEEAKPVTFVQRAGDIVYIPEGWYHATVSIGSTISMTRQPLLARENSSYSYILEADAYKQKKNSVESYTSILRALEVARGHEQIDFNLMRRVGEASEKLYQNKSEALLYYKNSIRMNYLHPAAYVELVGLYYDLKQYKHGLKVVTVAESRVPPVSHPSLSRYKEMLLAALKVEAKASNEDL